MFDADSLLTRKLILVTGKGGIGKTLVAAALAQASAARGKRTLLVESSARDQLAPLFGSQGTDHAERQLLSNLSCANFFPKDNFRDYIVKYLGKKALYETLFNHKVVQSFFDAIPGLAEIMLLGRLLYHCELQAGTRADVVIFDGFASGHFLNLMTTPEALLQTKFGGPIVRESERIRAFLADPLKCGIIFVTAAEDLVVSETLDFLPRLTEKSPAKIYALALNRVSPALTATTPTGQAASYAALLPSPAGYGATYEFLTRRAAAARSARATLVSGLSACGLQPELWELPELGFVNEPLPPGFGARFLAGDPRAIAAPTVADGDSRG